MYWKALMRNGSQEYNAYATGYAKAEAIFNIRCELLPDEADDGIFCITEIDEDEYIEGYKRFGDGIREVM